MKQDDFFNQPIQSKLPPDEGIMEHGFGQGDYFSAGYSANCGDGKGRQAIEGLTGGSGIGSSSGTAMPGYGRGNGILYPFINGV